MQYLSHNFRTKKAAKEAIAAGQDVYIQVAEPQLYRPADTKVAVGGPWYPRPHVWYGTATIDPATRRILKLA